MKANRLQLKLDVLKEKYKVTDGILFHNNEGWKLAVPTSLRMKVIQLGHDSLEHFDADRTFKFCQQYFDWNGMSAGIKRYVNSCAVCQKTRSFHYYRDNFGNDIASRVMYSKPGKQWAMDLHGVEKDEEGYNTILVMIDLCTRFVILVPLKNKDQDTVVSAIEQYLITPYGSGLEILSDEGSEFVNKFADALSKLYGIKLVTIKTATPHENGMVERWNRTFVNHFKKACQAANLGAKKWSSWSKRLTALYNTTYCPAIGNSPYFSLNGREYDSNLVDWSGISTHKSKSKEDPMDVSIKERYEVNNKLQKIILEKFMKAKKNSEIDNLVNNRFPHFDIGDLVLVATADSNDSSKSKHNTHAGPFEIKGSIGSKTYLIAGAGDSKYAEVHCLKLINYIPSSADLVGSNQLAPSAIGAALARSFSHDEVDKSK